MPEEVKIKTRVILEIAGYPREHVEETMKGVLERIQNAFDVLHGDVFQTKEVKQLWYTFSEIEIKFKNVEELVGFCFDYMPSSIEILDPMVDLNVKVPDLTAVINDLLARLHQYDMLIKNLRAENIVLKKRLQPQQNNQQQDKT